MLSNTQMCIQRTTWLPLLLVILLTSSCQFVPKKYYQESETKSTLAQRSTARQAEHIRELKQENAKLAAMNTALRNELGGLGRVVKQINDVRQKEKVLIRKAVTGLKQEKKALQQRLIALQEKYVARQQQKLETLKSAARVVMPKKLTPDNKPKPPAEPLPTPKAEKTFSDNDLTTGEPQPSSSPQSETTPKTVPTKVPSSAQEPKLSRQVNEKDHEQPQTHKQQLAKNHTQSASSMSISSPTRINVNNGTAENIMTHLGLSADIAEGIVTNRPYRFPAELVLKGVVTKKTYNKIKEKIVATP